MNSFIESLNLWGERFLSFGWPMLWQSSLLITLLFAIDFAIRRRVRAAVRYALWLVILLKLVLPPSLALPTSAAWWLRTPPPSKLFPQTKHFVVTYDDAVDPTLASVITTSLLAPVPPPVLSRDAWILLGSSLGSFGLLGFLCFRWQQVTRVLRRTEPAPHWANELFADAQKELRSRKIVRFRLTNCTMSPAVCGLLNPVVVLPRSLLETLRPSQLQAVLLHELIHLRRGDVWVNCAQALLQIVYWWHPLLWLANARIRRVREEAVDDAVMLALGSENESYAPTLLEVAKLAFARPLASLGLVGILESRSALRQRVERLVNFRAPRKAGLTLLSLLGVAVFAALAAPMSQSPEMVAAPPANSQSTGDDLQSLKVMVNPEVFIRNIKARASEVLRSSSDDYTVILLDILRAEGVDCNPPHAIGFTKTGEITTWNTPEKLRIFQEVINELNLPGGQRILLPHGRKTILIEAQLYKLRSQQFDQLGLDEPNGPQRLGSSVWLLLPERLGTYKQRIASLGLQPVSRPRIQTAHGISAALFVGDTTNSVQLECLPFIMEKGEPGVEVVTVVHTAGWFGNKPAGDWPTIDGHTNCAISARVAFLDNGGAILRAENANGRPENNLVVLLTAKIVSTEAHAPSEHGVNGTATPGVAVSPVAPDRIFAFDEEAKTTNVESGVLEAHFVFSITNVSQSDVTLTGIVTSCGCTIAKLPATPWVLSPGASGEIPVVMDLRGRSGTLTKTLQVNSDKITKTLTVTASIRPPTTKETTINEASAAKTVVAPVVSDATNLYTRVFKVNPNTLYMNLSKQTGITTTNVTENLTALRKIISDAGADLQSPKNIYFNDNHGTLLVRATLADFDAIEKVLQVLNYAPPQINIRSKFVSMQESFARSLMQELAITNGTIADGRTALLDATKAKSLLKRLESEPGVDVLTAPEVTTLSGRQAQIQVVDMMTVVKGIRPKALTPPGVTSSNNSIDAVLQTENLPIGPTVDFIPSVSADGYTIQLTVTPTISEFLGYDKPTNSATVYVNGKKQSIMPPLPRYHVHQMTSTCVVWDGQTVVLGGLTREEELKSKEKVPVLGDIPAVGRLFRSEKTVTTKKTLLVFVTPTLIDSAGNTLHSDEEMASARKEISTQGK